MQNGKGLKKFIVSITESEIPYHTSVVQAESKEALQNELDRFYQESNRQAQSQLQEHPSKQPSGNGNREDYPHSER